MQETRVQSLSQEDPLEKEIVTYSSILAWEIRLDRGAWWATVHGVTGSDTTEQLKDNNNKLSLNSHSPLASTVVESGQCI